MAKLQGFTKDTLDIEIYQNRLKDMQTKLAGM